ncbi:Hypothetical predicted protein, partial [Pelobates cultripes]
KERNALKQLMRSEDITIKAADKGGGLVILNTSDYGEENRRLLGDTNTYLQLKGDPTIQYQDELKEILNYGKDRGILNEREYKYLYVQYPRIPVFYHLPKIHKRLVKPPGRPIVSGIGSLTSNLSEYVDQYLQPLQSLHTIRTIRSNTCHDYPSVVTFTIIGNEIEGPCQGIMRIHSNTCLL